MKLSKVAIAFFLLLGFIASSKLTNKNKSKRAKRGKKKYNEVCDPTTIFDDCDSGLNCHELQKKCLYKQGEPCAANEMCFYGKCQDKKCKGDPVFGEYCLYSSLKLVSDCAIGFSCDKETKKCLKSDEQKCNANSECISKNCDKESKVCLGLGARMAIGVGRAFMSANDSVDKAFNKAFIDDKPKKTQNKTLLSY